jgi:hypothetical protein
MRPIGKFCSQEDFHDAAQCGRARRLGVRRLSPDRMQLLDDVGRMVRLPWSDGRVDRMGDTILADGWVYDDYEQNAVVLFAHDASKPPIGRGLDLTIEGGALVGTIKFAEAVFRHGKRTPLAG